MEGQKARQAQFALIREAMPGVQKLVAEHRQRMGDAWVTECVRRGMAGEPGWFFAREGALWCGSPPTEPEFVALVATRFTSTQVTVYLREPESNHGAH